MIKGLALAAGLTGAMMGVASAAPFCITYASGMSNCVYYDGNQCQKDAERANAACQPNPIGIGLRQQPNLGGTYCMVLPSGVSQCGYADGGSCAAAAKPQNAICNKTIGSRSARDLPDPYTPNAGR